jgi:3-deoxy-manno-octulosonate cytidylyltransferase (CMP-KDO synthetase)
MNIVAIIPGRMNSSRFPGKPLAKILGKSMLHHVYHRSKLSKMLNEVYIATCDKAIEDDCRMAGMKVIMTKDTHERASDRAAEAMLKIEKESGKKIDIVVMIQGDEPMLVPEMIDLALAPFLKDKDILVSNLMSEIRSEEEFVDPNTIKVVVDENNFALYFSREPIPTAKRAGKGILMLKQVCVIPFKRDFLITFNAMAQTSLEKAESIDMLRVLEHGFKVKMVMSNHNTYSVDTIDDLKRVEKFMANDPLVKSY